MKYADEIAPSNTIAIKTSMSVSPRWPMARRRGETSKGLFCGWACAVMVIWLFREQP
jgi:hypothetical protein